MSDALFERYKDALRRGHVAALRGRLDAAVLAYGEAIEIAPERALPYASLGSTLHRLGRHDEALAAYGQALERSPRDEQGLAGRAEVLVSLGRPTEAADTLDVLAGGQEAAGRLPDACDTVRRALELAESRERRRHVERLIDLLRDAVGSDPAAAAALERASALVTGASPAAPAPEPERPPDPVAVVTEAEARIDVGDAAGARDLLVQAAALHRAAGRLNAALDSCYMALAIAPGDAELHVILAELYDDSGWRGPAAEKLRLLGRLVDLTADTAGRDRMCSLIRRRFSDDPELVALCA
ncbi:MAG: tetratricopeptide repeat protein [Chloroflexota bacterium]